MSKPDKSNPPHGNTIKVSDLPNAGKTDFLLSPDSVACKQLAQELGILGISKLRFSGNLRPMGKADWLLVAKLGASVQQTCVVTLEPVTSRIDVEISRQFIREMPDWGDEDEREMIEDENIEPLGDAIDLGATMAEALALHLPPYPKKAGAQIQKTDFAAPGIEPLSDETVKPFAGLAALRDKLNK